MTGELRKEDLKKHLQSMMAGVEKKVVYYSQKTFVDADHVYHVVRDFFLELHDKSYEATYEDLIRELNSNSAIVFLSDELREKCVAFLQEISEAQYSGRGSDAETYKQYLLSFVDLAREITAPHDTSLDELIFEGLASIDRDDHQSARKKYRAAKDKYESLPEHEQHRYYESLSRLYSSLR